MAAVDASSWFLTAQERGNPASGLRAWSEGNAATPLVHGSVYFEALRVAVARLAPGDLLLFTDWRGDPDQRLSDADAGSVADLFAAAAARGVDVRGLLWHSHWDRLAFSAAENRHLGDAVGQAGGECLLDMRVRTGGSHHQKFVVLRHHGRPELDIAYVGGIDLCHSRRDDEQHDGDAQRQPMAAVYGPRPPWHDVMLALQGPAVGDVETVFRERWDDRSPLTRNPYHWIAQRIRGERRRGSPLPAQLPDPPATGPHAVQLLRTYPNRLGGYPFAPHGERSIAHGYTKALQRARCLVYVEDQYLWSTEVAETFAEALQREPELQVIAVLPHHPDQDGRFSLPPNLVGRERAASLLREAGGDRVAIYGIENSAGTPIYVHAKVCVVDDVWATVGSDNFNRRSWTHDSELSAAVLDGTQDSRAPRDPGAQGDLARRYARDLRMALIAEHLDRPPTDESLVDPRHAFAEMRSAAMALQQWHDAGRTGPRPAGRLRPLVDPPLTTWTKHWAAAAYRTVYDPDGRPRSLRRRRTF
ncbi:MAG: hypothetical protein QOI82_2694 [Actinomycetota bacterium]|nr:hypothetical protein [Actinomycetota bacterium]